MAETTEPKSIRAVFVFDKCMDCASLMNENFVNYSVKTVGCFLIFCA